MEIIKIKMKGDELSSLKEIVEQLGSDSPDQIFIVQDGFITVKDRKNLYFYERKRVLEFVEVIGRGATTEIALLDAIKQNDEGEFFTGNARYEYEKGSSFEWTNPGYRCYAECLTYRTENDYEYGCRLQPIFAVHASEELKNEAMIYGIPVIVRWGESHHGERVLPDALRGMS